MKKLILLIVCISVSVGIFAQSADDKWTKDTKTELINECIGVLSAKYPNVSEDQRDNVAICYANTISTSYPKRSDWLNKVDLEVKKIKASALEGCIKNNGVEAQKPKPESAKIDTPKEVQLSKAALAGVWEFDGRKFTFTEGGTYLYEGKMKKCNGQWSLSNKTITLSPSSSVSNKTNSCSNEEHEIVTFSPNEMDLLKTGDRKVLHLKKVK